MSQKTMEEPIKSAKAQKKGTKTLREMRLVPGEQGGMTVEHHFKSSGGPEYFEPESHPFSTAREGFDHAEANWPGGVTAPKPDKTGKP